MCFFDVKCNPKEYSPLALAFIGDSVYDVFIRGKLLEMGNRHVTDLHKSAIHYVSASAQAQTVHLIKDELTEEEDRIIKWGRNAKSYTVPKNADVTDYRLATGFETLIGYLYLEGNFERLNTILELSYRTRSDIQ